MVCFDTSGAMALSKEDMEKLVVRGSGSDIKAKLEACGVHNLTLIFQNLFSMLLTGTEGGRGQ